MSITLAVIFGTLSLAGYGLSDYFGAISSKRVGSFESVLISRAVALALLVVAAILFFHFPVLTPLEMGLLLLTAFFTTVGLLSFYKGFAIGDVSIVASIGNASGAVTVILLLVFLGASLTAPQSMFVAAIIAGTVLVAFKLKDLHKLNVKKAVRGSEYATLTMMSWGTSAFLGVVLIHYLGWFFPVLFVYALLFVYNIAYFYTKRIKFAKIGNSLPLIALTGITAVIGYGAFNYGIAASNAPVIVAPLSAAAPVLTVILAFVLLREKIDISQKVGIALILLSIIGLSLS